MARKKKNAGSVPLTSPQTREEHYLANIAGLVETKPEYPFTRVERYLDAISGSTSGLGDRVTALEIGKLDVIGKGINLLDNAYFIGGGTAGKFPVNQKGATSYNATGAICIDRWVLNQNTLSLTAAGLKANTGSSINLIQYFEDERIDDGQTYTLSVLTDTGCVSISAVLDKSATPSSGWQMSTPAGNGAWAGLKHDPAGSPGKWHLRLTASSDSTVIKAIKLELGSQQTLARKVGNDWVLNDAPPNYQQELAKCQRYLQVFEGWEFTPIGHVYPASATQLSIAIPLTVPMKGVLASIGAETTVYVSTNGIWNQTVTIPASNQNVRLSPNFAQVDVTLASALSGTFPSMALLSCTPTTKLIISAE